MVIDLVTTHLGPGWDRPVAVLVTAPGGAEPAAYAVGPPGAIVTIAAPELGSLVNRMKRTDECAPWTYGASHLMRHLAGRGLL